MNNINNKLKMSQGKKILLSLIITIFFVFILIKIYGFMEDKILLDDLKNQINTSDSNITIYDLQVTSNSYTKNMIDIGVIVSYDYEEGLSSNERAASALKIRDVVQNYLDTHSISKYSLISNIQLYIRDTYESPGFKSAYFMSFTNQYNDSLETVFDEGVVSGKKLDSMQCRNNIYSTDDFKYFSDCKSIYLYNENIDDFSFLEDFSNLKCIYIRCIKNEEDIEMCKKYLPSGCTIYVYYNDGEGNKGYTKIQV